MAGRSTGVGASLAVAAMVVAAGCIAGESVSPGSGPQGAQPPPEAAPPAEFDEGTGALSGRVINEEGLPIAGATAALQEIQAQSVADVQGLFTFSTLAPGEYTLFVQQLGYESTARRVTVVAGDITHVNLQLVAVAIDEPYYETIVEKGNVQCSVRAYPGVPTTGAGGLPPWVTGVAVCGLTSLPGFAPDRFLIRYEIPETVGEMLVEMEWTSTQAAGNALSFVLEHSCCANSPANTFGRDEGRSPLSVHANETIMQSVAGSSEKDCFADGCQLMTRVFAEAETTGITTPVPLGPFPPPLGDPRDRVDVGLTFDQRFTQYFTHFHNMVMPGGFSALADA